MNWANLRVKLEKLIADKNSPFGKYNFREALSLLVRERFISRTSKSEVRDAVIFFDREGEGRQDQR
jgi:hypothetical protein